MAKLRTLTVAASFAASLLGFAQSAQATIIFTPGNHPQPGEMNILFGAAETGSTITGQAGGIDVQFASLTAQTLHQNAAGQAQITNNAGGILTSIAITVPGHTFQDFILNLQGLSGNASVSVTDNLSNVASFTLAAGPGGGANFLTITTAPGELITDISISAANGFDNFKQPRISGISGGSVPEPASLALLGSALLGYRLFRRQKA